MQNTNSLMTLVNIHWIIYAYISFCTPIYGFILEIIPATNKPGAPLLFLSHTAHPQKQANNLKKRKIRIQIIFSPLQIALSCRLSFQGQAESLSGRTCRETSYGLLPRVLARNWTVELNLSFFQKPTPFHPVQNLVVRFDLPVHLTEILKLKLYAFVEPNEVFKLTPIHC